MVGIVAILYLDVSIVVIMVKHNSLDIIIPKGTSKVLKLANPPPPLPPLPKMVVHLGGSHLLPRVLP